MGRHVTGREPRAFAVSFVASAALLATACGGGGGGGGGGGNPTPAATRPSFTSAATVSVLENKADGFYTAAATDPQNDAVTISLYSGTDADKFVLAAGGVLRFNTPPNYDLPTDANGDNVYQVTLRASAGGETTDLALSVTVTNDREGVAVKRIVTGLVNPVAMAMGREPDTGTLRETIMLIAEKGGRVFEYDPNSGTVVEDVFIRDNKRRGEILAIAYGFRGNAFQEGTYILTHDPIDGLYLQAFNAQRGTTGFVRLGDPWEAPVTASMIGNGGVVFIAIGDAGGARAQDASTPYGKLVQLPFVDPYAGASLQPPIIIRPATIGDGIQKPGGFSPEFGRIYLADGGSSVQNEITIFQTDWRPLDFGWPFYEGSQALRTNPPAAINGPTIVYPFGTGRKQGTGALAGLINNYNFFSALGNTYVFADRNGTIWSIGYDKLINGVLRTASDLEVRTEDFAPDQGSLNAPVAIVASNASDRFYLLDAGGELFRAEPAP